jgi:transcriptional antiterminator NusG
MFVDAIESSLAKAISLQQRGSEYWYAVNAFTGQEDRIKGFISDHFSDFYLLYPKRLLTVRRQTIVKTIEKPLFPGYFFIKTPSPLSILQARAVIDTCYKRLGTPVKVLGARRESVGPGQIYRTIPEQEIRFVLFLTRQGERIDFSTYHKVGSKVKVVSGPLVGQEAIIRRVNPRKNRITIQLTIFGANHQIDIGGECLSKSELQ